MSCNSIFIGKFCSLYSVLNANMCFKNVVTLFKVLNSYNTSTARSIRCFHHFKCLICQIEIYGSEALVYHSGCKSHQEMSKHYTKSDTEKLRFMSTTLDKLHETEKKLKEKDESLMKLTAKLASRRLRFES